MFKEGLEYSVDNWNYCNGIDRRFYSEVCHGLQPAGMSPLHTNISLDKHCKILSVNQTLCFIVKDKSVHCSKQIKSIQSVFILHSGHQQILTKDISLPFL